MKKFNLSDYITFLTHSSGNIPVVRVKEFLKECYKHTYTTEDGIRVIDLNKLKELAGEAFK